MYHKTSAELISVSVKFGTTVNETILHLKSKHVFFYYISRTEFAYPHAACHCIPGTSNAYCALLSSEKEQ